MFDEILTEKRRNQDDILEFKKLKDEIFTKISINNKDMGYKNQLKIKYN